MFTYLKRSMILVIPATIVFLCFTPYRKRALSAMKLKSSLRREIALILFVMSIFAILEVTLEPAYIWQQDENAIWGNINIAILRPTWDFNLSLMPFTEFKNYIDGLTQGPAMFFLTLLNFFGNLFVFVPIGLFPALLFRNATWKRSFAVGFGMSLFIEVSQYFICRNVAVDDLILNTLGAMFGYLIYLFLKKHWPKFTDSFLCQRQ